MDKNTYKILSQVQDLKHQLELLTHEVNKVKAGRAEDAVFIKALNSTVDNLAGQVQDFDKKVVENTKKAEAQTTEAVTTESAKKMSLTQIGQLFKKDPAKAAEVMRQQGMNPSAGLGAMNPWVFNDRKEQELLEQVDPAKAATLKAEAAKVRN